MFRLITIRYIQIKRILSEAGPGIVLLAGLLWMLIYQSYQAYQTRDSGLSATLILFLVCFLIQVLRKDKDFVYTHIEKPVVELYTEYFLLTLPFSFTSLLTSQYYCFFLLLFSLLALPYLRYNFRYKAYFKNITRIIPAGNVEWVSGFRKYFAVLIPLYLLALALSWFRIAPLILLWLFTFVVLTFYNEFEPLIILRANHLNPVAFMKDKVRSHTTIIIVLYLPVVILASCFNPEYAEINFLFLGGQIALICFSVCIKYAAYYPSQRQMGNSAVLALVVLTTMIPFLLPITVLMVIDYYSKAKSNLKNYLNDSF